MKKFSKLLSLALATGVVLGMSSCNKFLDENPDGALVEGNTPYKISRFLTYAYPLSSLANMSELSSDNTYEDETRNPYRQDFHDWATYWKPITTTDGVAYFDGPQKFWEACYYAIAQANEVLTLIEETQDFGERNMASRGEALAVRAWSHFQLANIFALPFNFDGQDGATNLGVPYVAERVTTILPDYPRETVKRTYELIEKDLLAAIPLLERYNVYQSDIRHFHFTAEAAYAFATRFYLYYNQPEKAKEYADKLLGSNPASHLRDWARDFTGVDAANANAKALVYYKPTNPANLLVISLNGYFQDVTSSGETFTNSRYTHSNKCAADETLWKNIWNVRNNRDEYYFAPYIFDKVFTDKVYQPKMPILNSYRTVEVQLTTDEALINRAEAKIRLGDLEGGLADLNVWTNAYLRAAVAKRTFTQQEIEDYYAALPYADRTTRSPKKHLTKAHFKLHDGSSITEGTATEALLQYVLQCRRVLTLHEGLRWQDIRRYGIDVYRWKKVDAGAGEFGVLDEGVLPGTDLRQAIALPQIAVTGKIKQNPR